MPGWDRTATTAEKRETIQRLLENFKDFDKQVTRQLELAEIETPIDLPEVDVPEFDDENLDYDTPEIDDDELKHLSADDTVYPLVPRDYQMEGSMFLRQKKRGMCTDDAGLGKTLTAAEAATGPTLVAVPSYLTEQWHTFLTKQYPNDNVILSEGSRSQRTRAIRTVGQDWYIVNHQMFRTYGMPDNMGTLIVDEAHHFRNRGAGQTKGLYEFVEAEENADMNVYLLTASPVYTSVDNLWSMLHIIDPEVFDNYNAFLDMYCITSFNTYGPKVMGTRRTRRAELKKLLDFVRIGRTYKEVGRFLPPIIGHAIKVQIPEEVKKLYQDVRYRAKIQWQEDDGSTAMMPMFSASAVLHSLRAVTSPAKIIAIADRLDDIPPKKGVVIGCWYRDTARRMYDEIIKRQSKNKEYRSRGKVVCITGDEPVAERRRLAMSGHTVICTIGALSEGVNLYHMRAVIYLEEHYSPGANYQLLRRVRRDRNDDGQDREPVLVWYVYVPKTADEVIHQVSRKRGGGAKEVLSEIFQ